MEKVIVLVIPTLCGITNTAKRKVISERRITFIDVHDEDKMKSW